MQADIAVVGAGPAGLAFARSMQGSGYRVVVIDRQPDGTLSQPAFDGREIALTHASRGILESLDAWQRIDAGEISALRDAKVFNGPSHFALRIDASMVGVEQLGYFVPNHLIRKALYESVQECSDIELLCGASVKAIRRTGDAMELEFADERRLTAKLVVAADSRYSETRRMMGIGAHWLDFARTMMVCRFQHEKPHHHVAWQWFDFGQTKALLPLNGNASNVVLTLAPNVLQALLSKDDAAFSADISRRFDHRLGAMEKQGPAHSYPLIGVYAEHFCAPRYALIGDAAVGMHPVTAHGFNFGLQSQKRLAEELWLGKRRNMDVGDLHPLRAYERKHRLATWPLYQATNGIARFYTDDRRPVRLLRGGALRLAQAVQPFRKALAGHLTQS